MKKENKNNEKQTRKKVMISIIILMMNAIPSIAQHVICNDIYGEFFIVYKATKDHHEINTAISKISLGYGMYNIKSKNIKKTLGELTIHTINSEPLNAMSLQLITIIRTNTSIKKQLKKHNKKWENLYIESVFFTEIRKANDQKKQPKHKIKKTTMSAMSRA